MGRYTSVPITLLYFLLLLLRGGKGNKMDVEGKGGKVETTLQAPAIPAYTPVWSWGRLVDLTTLWRCFRLIRSHPLFFKDAFFRYLIHICVIFFFLQQARLSLHSFTLAPFITLLQTHRVKLDTSITVIKIVGVASYGALGHLPPQLATIIFPAHFGAAQSP